MILASARKWGFTKAGGPRGYALVRAGEPLPSFIAPVPAPAAAAAAAPPPPAAPTVPAPEEPKASGNVIYIYDIIGRDWWTGEGVTSERVMEDLAAIGAGADVEVRVNSPGGDVFDGIAIFNALARHKGKVTVHVDALSASIAGVIQLAGDQVLMAENALMMIHLPWSLVAGNADEYRQEAEILDTIWGAMAATYSRRSGMTAAAIRKKVTDGPFGEWWMTAADAVKAGFADGIDKRTEVKAMAEGARFRGAPEQLRPAAAEDLAVPARHAAAPAIDAPRVVRAGEEEQETRRRQVEVLEIES